jgi:PhoD-like phosphatase
VLREAPRDLERWRMQYALYKSDADLQAAHARFPWMVTWDDHEVQNDYANHQSQYEGAISALRAAAYQAWYEHQPVRAPARPDADGPRVSRRLRWGGLAQLDVVDGRQFRSVPPCGWVECQVSNPVVVTGDWHSTFVNDIKRDEVDGPYYGPMIGFNPHIKFLDGDRRGYTRLPGRPLSAAGRPASGHHRQPPRRPRVDLRLVRRRAWPAGSPPGGLDGHPSRRRDDPEDIVFVHPKDVQDGKVEIGPGDITANLPYTPAAHLVFDHHHSETLRNTTIAPNHIIDPDAPSAARVVYDHYGGGGAVPEHLAGADASRRPGRFGPVLAGGGAGPTGWELLNFLMDSAPALAASATSGSPTTSS